MIGIYLSGTGNTKHCTKKLVHLLDETAQVVPMEKKDITDLLRRHDYIILAYPVQFSNIPVMVRDFLKNHAALWKGKRCSVLLPWRCSAGTAQAARRGY